jgi:uncharacterized Zn-binding protein involved in type VI secretion
MPDYIYHAGASGSCAHGAQITVTAASNRVKVSGRPVATLGDIYTVSGCPFTIQIALVSKPQPCTTVKWLKAAGRVRVNHQPAILKSSAGICLSSEQSPQGAPSISGTQMRVKGQ